VLWVVLLLLLLWLPAARPSSPSLVGVASLLDEISVSLVAELSLFLPSWLLSSRLGRSRDLLVIPAVRGEARYSLECLSCEPREFLTQCSSAAWDFSRSAHSFGFSHWLTSVLQL